MRATLETDRLTLRQVRDEDAPSFSALAGDLDISRMTGTIPYPLPLLAAEFKILSLKARQRQNLGYPYAITQKGKDKLIGVMDLFRRKQADTLEIGYWIGRPYWGQSYATEAAKAIIDEAKTRLGVKQLCAGAFSDNPASLHILEKLGFKRTGITEMYFSIARMQKAPSVLFTLSLENDAGQNTADLLELS